jgi:hypothetical protein
VNTVVVSTLQIQGEEAAVVAKAAGCVRHGAGLNGIVDEVEPEIIQRGVVRQKLLKSAAHVINSEVNDVATRPRLNRAAVIVSDSNGDSTGVEPTNEPTEE